MTEEQMLDYFQKNAIPHEQRGGKLFVGDLSQVPGGMKAYFTENGFFKDAGKKSVEEEVQETVAEEAVGGGANATVNPAPGDEPAETVKPGPEAPEPKATTKKAPAKKAATKAASKSVKK